MFHEGDRAKSVHVHAIYSHWETKATRPSTITRVQAQSLLILSLRPYINSRAASIYSTSDSVQLSKFHHMIIIIGSRNVKIDYCNIYDSHKVYNHDRQNVPINVADLIYD